MPGLIFTLGGKLDPSYKGALAQSVTEAKAAALQIQRAKVTEAVYQARLLQQGGMAAEIAQEGIKVQKEKLRLLEEEFNVVKRVNAEKASEAAIERTRLTYSEATRATSLSPEMIAQRRADILARNAARSSSLTYSEAPRATFFSQDAIDERRDLRRAQLRRHAGMTYSEAPVATNMTARLAGLRAGLAGGGAGAEAARAQIRALAQAGAVAGAAAGGNFMSRFMASMHGTGSGGAAQLVHVFRATFDSLASGMNPLRVLLQQGPQAFQAMTSMTGGFLRVILAVGGPLIAIGGIIGGIVIYFTRVNKLAEALKTTVDRIFNADHIAKYLQKVQEINQAQLDIATSLRSQAEAYDSVHERAERMRDLVKEQYDYERKKLEVLKENELAQATTAAQREAIEKKYAALGIQLNKQERADKLKSMQKELKDAEMEAAAKIAAAEKITKSDGYSSEAQEKKREENLRIAAENAGRYFASGGEGDKDRATTQEYLGRNALPGAYDALVAKKKAAQERIDQNRADQKSYNDFLDTGDSRKRTHDRVSELEKASKDAALGADKLRKELDPNNPTGTVARFKQADKNDADIEGARDSRKAKAGGKGGSSISLSEWERAGGFMGGPQITMVDEQRKTNKILARIDQNTRSGGKGAKGVHFGGPR